NAAFGYLRDRRIESLRSIGAYDQQIDTAGDKILDVCDLLRVIVAGIGDQKLLDHVCMIVCGLLERMQSDHSPAVTEARVSKSDDVRRSLLELRSIANADIEGWIKQECPRRTGILRLCARRHSDGKAHQ